MEKLILNKNSEVVERSILEFEYHCDMIRWMGYGTHWQDFKCNVHIGRFPSVSSDIQKRTEAD